MLHCGNQNLTMRPVVAWSDPVAKVIFKEPFKFTDEDIKKMDVEHNIT